MSIHRVAGLLGNDDYSRVLIGEEIPTSAKVDSIPIPTAAKVDSFPHPTTGDFIPHTFDRDAASPCFELLVENPGYHKRDIPRGWYGEASKIFEEVEEFRDAFDQGAKIMQLAELSDVIGAIEGFLSVYYPYVKLSDLIQMKDLTHRAFTNGHRIAR